MIRLILSCEHGGNDVPDEWLPRRRCDDLVLTSHRGLDLGALELARELAQACAAPLVFATVTRLLIDLNREQGSRTMFSPEAFELDEDDRQLLIERYWRPHHEQVESLLRQALDAGDRVLYLSVHSFTPVFDGRERKVDLGLLIDPGRAIDAELARHFATEFERRRPGLAIAMNEPYSGLEEGLDRAMRARFGDRDCMILTLELNQRFPQGDGAAWRALRQAITATVRQLLEDPELQRS
ncbi:MAG: N-formylglutamate amidohydrolase [Planctomycetes bacterium]|nr:N-formylglutamate amidohydrolase [Planctomycetota bacterium]